MLEMLFVEPGTLRFEYRDFAFLSEESLLAAEAARCANDQGEFWAYHDLIFYNQQNPTLDGLSRSTLDILAEHLELDMGQFTACMDDQVHRDAVLAEVEEGRELGVGGTPAFVLDGELVTELDSYQELFEMIEEKIAASS